MADQPTHMLIIESKDGTELRRFGPMHLGRAHSIKHAMENTEEWNKIENTLRIIDSPNWNFELGKEIS